MAFLMRAAIFGGLAILTFGQRRAAMPLPPGGYGRAPSRALGTPPINAPEAKPPIVPQPVGQPGRRNPPNPTVVIVPFATYGYPDPGLQQDVGPDSVQPPDVTPPMPTYDSPPPQGIPRMGMYSPDDTQTCMSAAVEPSPPRGPEAPTTIYLIALKNQQIVQALGYWMEAGTLHYVSSTFGLNQVSISLVDREFSQRLNDERGVKFSLSASN